MTTITLPADQIGDTADDGSRILIVGECPHDVTDITGGNYTATERCRQCKATRDGYGYSPWTQPQWVLDLLEPCNTCKHTVVCGDQRIDTEGRRWVNGRSVARYEPFTCPDCHEGRRPFTLRRECDGQLQPHGNGLQCDGGCAGTPTSYATPGYIEVGVFVVTDMQPRDDDRYNVLITEVPL